MVIGGLWHGAAMTFVVWGALHGLYLTGERWVKGRWAAQHPDPVLPAALTAVLQWVLTFNLVCLAWIFFRAQSIGTAFEVIGGIVGGVQPNEMVTGLLLATIALMLASQFVPPRAVERAQMRLHRARPWPPGRRPRRRPHVDRRPRPRRRRPVHLLQVLMHSLVEALEERPRVAVVVHGDQLELVHRELPAAGQDAADRLGSCPGRPAGRPGARRGCDVGTDHACDGAWARSCCAAVGVAVIGAAMPTT